MQSIIVWHRVTVTLQHLHRKYHYSIKIHLKHWNDGNLKDFHWVFHKTTLHQSPKVKSGVWLNTTLSPNRKKIGVSQRPNPFQINIFHSNYGQNFRKKKIEFRSENLWFSHSIIIVCFGLDSIIKSHTKCAKDCMMTFFMFASQKMDMNYVLIPHVFTTISKGCA